MNTSLLPRKVCFGQLMLLLILLGLTGCGNLDSFFMGADSICVEEGSSPGGEACAGDTNSNDVGAESTPAVELLSYTNKEYGFSFIYPESWKTIDGDHAVVLVKGPYRLEIKFWRIDEISDPYTSRTGLPAGNLNYADKIRFLDQVMPVEVLIFEEKSKIVFYGGAGPIEVDDLLFDISLEYFETVYENIDLSEEIMQESKTIVESFQRVEAFDDSNRTSDASDPGLVAYLEAPEKIPVGESLNIKFTLKNVSDIPIYVLQWYTPLEGIAGEIFQVTLDGKTLPYEGILASRIPPTSDAYVFLTPGESVSAVVDLSRSFDLSKVGTYRLKFISPRISHVARTEAEMANTMEELGPVNIPSNEISIEIVASIQVETYPRLRTLEEARDMIEYYLREQGHDLGIEPIIPIEELQFEDLWAALEAQVFRVIEGDYKYESFLIRGDDVIQLGNTAGGQGLTSLMISDLDQDSHAELLFTYSFETGKPRSKIGAYMPAFDKHRIIEANVVYLGYLSLTRDSTGVGVRDVEADQDTRIIRYQDLLCYLAIEDQNGQAVLVLKVPDGSPCELD